MPARCGLFSPLSDWKKDKKASVRKRGKAVVGESKDGAAAAAASNVTVARCGIADAADLIS
jgi:hypothetical protein